VGFADFDFDFRGRDEETEAFMLTAAGRVGRLFF
jgi:hypothetical protein